jgi:UDP-3-O-[3-hydroxymyristoyl] glucosamine N-acyltransferase
VQARLADIVKALGGRLEGHTEQVVSRISPLAWAKPGEISFLSHVRYAHELRTTQASAVIVSDSSLADFEPQVGQALILTPEPYLYYARLTQWWAQQERLEQEHDDRLQGLTSEPRIHPSSVIHPLAQVAQTARVGPLCVIERGAVVGEGTWLKSRVSVGERCVIGTHCIVHSGVVIGADGFGFAKDGDGPWCKIEQLGAVRIGDHVEIGANTCIDRGALVDTVIEDGVKLDNLIQIGHNVHIGAHSALAGCVGVAGSATIGKYCTVGGGAVILGHLSLADSVHISASSVVTRSIAVAGHYSGFFPLDENAQWEKNAASLKQLHRLRQRILALEQAASLSKGHSA